MSYHFYHLALSNCYGRHLTYFFMCCSWQKILLLLLEMENDSNNKFCSPRRWLGVSAFLFFPKTQSRWKMFHERKKWEQNLINLFLCPLSPQTFFCGDIFVNFERTEKKSRKIPPLKGKKSNLIACVNCLISGMYCSMAIYICTNTKGTLYSLLQFRLDLIYVIHISGLFFFFQGDWPDDSSVTLLSFSKQTK